MQTAQDFADDTIAQNSGEVNTRAFSSLIDMIEGIIDEGSQITHSKISGDFKEKFLKGEKDIKKIVKEFNSNTFDLSPNAKNNDQNLQYENCVLMLGTSLGSQQDCFNSFCGRTLLVDPTKEQHVAYQLAIEAWQICLNNFKPGNDAKNVYIKAKQYIQDKNPGLAKYFGDHVGFFVEKGQYKPPSTYINQSLELEISKGAIAALSITLKDIPKPPESKMKSSTYSIFLCDTIMAQESNPLILTKQPRRYNDISYFLEEEQESEQEEEKETKLTSNNTSSNMVRPSRLRDEKTKMNKMNEEKRGQKQVELRNKKLEDLEKRYKSGQLGKISKEKETKSLSEIQSYKSVTNFPGDLKKNQIFVDMKGESILLPFQNKHIPFHVSCIKNAFCNSEGKDSYLRLNFFYPGAAAQLKDTVNTLPEVKGPNGMYIREVVYKSNKHKEMQENHQKLIDLIKKVRAKQLEQREKKDLVDQYKLQLIKGKKPVLQDLTIRPNISGKRTQGALEAHHNGFRFQSNKGERLDITYSNIKHAFFQPVENELIVLIHFHLHNPIMVGKKKSIDVQFFQEAGVQTDDLDQRRRNAQDADEIQSEIRERELRKKLNEEFRRYIQAVESVAGEQIEFDMPYRDLGFDGVPQKSNVFLMPTATCIVNLTDPPFFVVTLDEIELVHLERVSFSLKNFDMVLIYKDYSRAVTRISQIPVAASDSIKDWLTTVEIMYTEGPQSLNWTNIMKQIKQDLKAFVEDGGWNFLCEERTSSESQQSEDSENRDSEFRESEEDQEESSEYSDSEEAGQKGKSESEASASVSGTSESGSEEESEEEDEEEGMDWDEMEKKTRAGNFFISEEAEARKRKRQENENNSAKKRKRG